MPDEVTMAIVTAIAAKAAEVTAGGVKTGVSALFRLIRARFGPGTDESAALASALAHPEDEAGRLELAHALRNVMAADPQFAAQVLAGWRAATSELAAEGGSVVNQFSGHAGNVLQVRDIGGDVRFGR
jgi:hypothetical protein